MFPYIGFLIIPIDFHIFQRGSNHQPVTILPEQWFCSFPFLYCQFLNLWRLKKTKITVPSTLPILSTRKVINVRLWHTGLGADKNQRAQTITHIYVYNMFIYIYIHIISTYIYIYIYTEYLHIYIYIYIHTHWHVYIYRCCSSFDKLLKPQQFSWEIKEIDIDLRVDRCFGHLSETRDLRDMALRDVEWQRPGWRSHGAVCQVGENGWFLSSNHSFSPDEQHYLFNLRAS